MTTPILGITEISGNQQNQYITANEAFRALEAASNDFLTVDLAAGTVTLTDAQFTGAYAFYGVGHGVTTALNVPASKRAFVVINGGTGNITVTRGAGTKTVAPGESMMLLTDGTTDGLYSVGGGGGGGAAVWGAITGTLSDQTDLQAALDAKADVSALGTMAAQNANAVAITGGAIDGTPIGAVTPSTVRGSVIDSTSRINALTGMTLGNTNQSGNNVLDWYEENGIFSPIARGSVSAGSATYSIRYGGYTRVGNIVFFDIRVGWLSHTGSGNLEFAGLPFTSSATSGTSWTPYYDSLTVGVNKDVIAGTTQSSSVIYFLLCDVAGGPSALLPLDGAVSEVRVAGFYFV